MMLVIGNESIQIEITEEMLRDLHGLSEAMSADADKNISPEQVAAKLVCSSL